MGQDVFSAVLFRKICPLAYFEHRLDTLCVSGAGAPRGADVHSTSKRSGETSTGCSALESAPKLRGERTWMYARGIYCKICPLAYFERLLRAPCASGAGTWM